MSPGLRKESSLIVRPRPVRWFLRRRFLPSFMSVASVAIIGLILIFVFTSPAPPFERRVTLEGLMGSKANFFHDGQVQKWHRGAMDVKRLH